jgi:ATP-dependent Clp endopeptidase proteolytic subunit ClpP
MPKLIELVKNNSGFSITNKSETKAEILLYSSIGESYFEDSISAKTFSEELKKLPSSVKEITLRVNSPGGSVFDGMTIYERLKSHPAKVTAYVDGLAASIASIIIMAADEIIVGDGAAIMIHKPMSFVAGNSLELERMIDVLDKIENQMISIYAKKTGMTRSEISAALAKETWYTSDEAIEAGLASKKFEAKETLHLAASMIESCTWFKNKPKIKNKNELVREKLREFNNKAKDFLNR